MSDEVKAEERNPVDGGSFWRTVHDDGDGTWLGRRECPGGWLYRYESAGGEEGETPLMSMCFVPTPPPPPPKAKPAGRPQFKEHDNVLCGARCTGSRMPVVEKDLLDNYWKFALCPTCGASVVIVWMRSV